MKKVAIKKEFITVSQFAEMLFKTNLSLWMQVQSVTEPKLNKKDREGNPNPFKVVLNCRDLNVQLGYDYEGQVGKREVREGAEEPTFEAKEHPWARRVGGQLARHKDYAIDIANLDFNTLDMTKLYMPYVKNRVDDQMYIADGKEIKKDLIVPFMPPKDNSYASQPIENKVKVEYMKLKSIKTFVVDQTEYQIVW